ncbi:MAG: DMT family transporter [Acidimicrobiales bacterium]
MLAVAAALGAAFLYAVASVLQHRAALDQPAEQSLRIGLITGLLRRPMWLLGIAADAGGFVLQFTALAAGAIVVVQPLLVLGLLFALPISAWASGRRTRGADHVAALTVCVGLALFLTFANPAPGRAFIGTTAWVALLVTTCGAAFVLAVAGRGVRNPAKAVLLAASTGVVYGLAAGLTKTTGQLFAQSIPGTFTHWPVYALAAIGLAGLVVGQSSFQAGSLELSLPTMSVVDPVVSVLIGALAFHETLASSPGALAAETGGLLLTTGGVYVLARAPAIRAVRGQPRG